MTIIPANHRLGAPIPPKLCAAQTLFPDIGGPFRENRPQVRMFEPTYA